MAQRLSKLERMRANDKSARESIGADGPRLAATPLTPIPAAKAALKTATFPVHSVPVNLVDPDPGQPRKHFDPDELAKLADTIRTSGQLQPGCAYLDPGKGRYILIFGERRLRATALAGLDRIDLKILPGVPTREEIRRIQRLENLQRVNLDPIEQALDYRRAIDEEGLKAKDLAEQLGVSKGAISKALSLVKLPNDIRAHISAGRISATAGYALSSLPIDKAREVAEWAVADGVSTSDVEEEVRRVLNPPKVEAPKPAPPRDAWRSWPTSCIPLDILPNRMQSALLVEGVRTLGTLEDRLDGAGFPSLPPADHEAFAVILDEVKRRKSPDQRELIIDPMAAALTPLLDPPHRPGLAGPVSDPSGILAEAREAAAVEVPAPANWRSVDLGNLPTKALSPRRWDTLRTHEVYTLGDLAAYVEKDPPLAGVSTPDLEAFRKLLTTARVEAEEKARTPMRGAWQEQPLSALDRVDRRIRSDRRMGALAMAGIKTLGELQICCYTDSGVDGFDHWDYAAFRKGIAAIRDEAEAEARRDLEIEARAVELRTSGPEAPHPIDAHLDRVKRMGESGSLAVSSGNSRTPAEVLKPSDPAEVGSAMSGTSMVYTFNPGDGRMASVMLPADSDHAGECIRMLEAMLRGARLTLGPAACFPVGSRVVIQKKGDMYNGYRGTVDRIEESGETFWVSLDEGKLCQAAEGEASKILHITHPEYLRKADR